MLFGLITTQKERDEAEYNADSSTLAQVDYWLEQGKMVNAIKAWRQHSGMGLKEAVAFINERANTMIPRD
jgi:ribosomal protein L7/L12